MSASSIHPIRVLFVCLGNICRSPLAEGIFKKMVKQKGLSERLVCDSAGTSDYHVGEGPDKRTINNAKMNGIALEHKAQQIGLQDFMNFDYIVVMDAKNHRDVSLLKEQVPEPRAKVLLMRHFDPEEICDTLDVPDPYFGGESGFQKVYGILYRSVLNFIEFLEKEHLKK